MGIILASKREKDKVIVETLLEHEELAQLRGEYDDVHLFSERSADIETNIAKRGKNQSTKYFLIPKHLRKDLTINEPAMCQRIDTQEKTIFVYIIMKDSFSGYKKICSRRAILPEEMVSCQ